MVLQGGPCGRVGRRRTFFQEGPSRTGWPFLRVHASHRCAVRWAAAPALSGVCRLAPSDGRVPGEPATGGRPTSCAATLGWPGREGRGWMTHEGRARLGAPDRAGARATVPAARVAPGRARVPREVADRPAGIDARAAVRPEAPVRRGTEAPGAVQAPGGPLVRAGPAGRDPEVGGAARVPRGAAKQGGGRRADGQGGRGAPTVPVAHGRTTGARRGTAPRARSIRTSPTPCRPRTWIG
jgi:hypothetical protein